MGNGRYGLQTFAFWAFKNATLMADTCNSNRRGGLTLSLILTSTQPSKSIFTGRNILNRGRAIFDPTMIC
jgi:hypothetical protein